MVYTKQNSHYDHQTLLRDHENHTISQKKAKTQLQRKQIKCLKNMNRSHHHKTSKHTTRRTFRTMVVAIGTIHIKLYHYHFPPLRPPPRTTIATFANALVLQPQPTTVLSGGGFGSLVGSPPKTDTEKTGVGRFWDNSTTVETTVGSVCRRSLHGQMEQRCCGCFGDGAYTSLTL